MAKCWLEIELVWEHEMCPSFQESGQHLDSHLEGLKAEEEEVTESRIVPT